MSLDKIKALLNERQERAIEFQEIHAKAEKSVASLIEKAGIRDEVAKIHAEREGHRQRLQSAVDHLTGKIEALMEAAGMTESELQAALQEEQSTEAVAEA